MVKDRGDEMKFKPASEMTDNQLMTLSILLNAYNQLPAGWALKGSALDRAREVLEHAVNHIQKEY